MVVINLSIFNGNLFNYLKALLSRYQMDKERGTVPEAGTRNAVVLREKDRAGDQGRLFGHAHTYLNGTASFSWRMRQLLGRE